MFVSYNPEFDVSSCGYSLEEALRNLREALEGFLESAYRREVLYEILEEAGHVPVFIIKNNLRTAGISRDRYFELLKQV